VPDLLTVGSCFSGIGGLDLGLEAAGPFKTVWHSEVRRSANMVMAARFPESAPMGDITTLVNGLFPPPPVDVLAGGPPCQGISQANSYGRMGLQDPRSALFHAYAALVDMVRPRWVVMEQVSGLLTSGTPKGADYNTVHDTLRGLGYEVAVVVVNSLAYVPQTRERLIIVCRRDGRPTGGVLLPLIEAGARHPHEGRPPRRRPTPRVDVGPHVYRKSRRSRDPHDAEKWVVADYANTLTLSDIGPGRATVMVVDREGRPRVMTPEEWEACHGFPRGWTDVDITEQQRWELLGNAVSPPVALDVGLGIAAVEAEEAAQVEAVCTECGDDLAAEGYAWCSECMERDPWGVPDAE